MPESRPALNAHGKMWCWWSFYEDVAVRSAGKDEREMKMVADADTFFLHPHYRAYDLVLVRAGRIDPNRVAAH